MINRQKFAQLSFEDKCFLGELAFYSEWQDEDNPDEALIKELENHTWADPSVSGADRFIQIVKSL
ncbi:hypothetical protein LCGC14_0882690 [marine sediment metagenome]|uniref:Uncharacterized protein n=1 Tax=marine sediment metagenome TaxID=412755 RepID=A0A0F9RKY4_9ZZZZ